MSDKAAKQPRSAAHGGRTDNGRQYCTLFVDDLAFGVDIRVVQEIVPYQTMTPVPLAPVSVVGLINLRGQIVTAIDLRRRLGLAPLAEGVTPFNVVVRIDDRVVSLLVDRFGDVVTIDEPPDDVPETLTGFARQLITGIHQLDERLLLVLDASAAIDVAGTAPLGEPPAIADRRREVAA